MTHNLTRQQIARKNAEQKFDNVVIQVGANRLYRQFNNNRQPRRITPLTGDQGDATMQLHITNCTENISGWKRKQAEDQLKIANLQADVLMRNCLLSGTF